MDALEEYLPDSELKLVRLLRNSLDEENYQKAYKLATDRLKDNFDLSRKAKTLLRIELANILIDVGSECGSAHSIRMGLQVYSDYEDDIRSIAPTSYVEYCQGNAKSDLHYLENSDRPKYDLSEQKLLTEAKNHYWRSFKKLHGKSGRRRNTLYTNLGNTLRRTGRIVEALQYYDSVLEESPDFPKANGNRASTLLTFSEISGLSTELLIQARDGFRKGAKGEHVPSNITNEWLEKADYLDDVLSHNDVN